MRQSDHWCLRSENGDYVDLQVLLNNNSKYIIHARFSTVYSTLVANGTIVPKVETAPPTVPMDFNWARVRST